MPFSQKRETSRLQAGAPIRAVGKLLRWFLDNARDIPWRRTLDPYAIWVSEIMLQQTQVKTVIPYWNRWMKELPTIQKLARARESKVLKLWEGLGYYTRARNLQSAAKQIVADHAGEFPTDIGAIVRLPGIGRYTAGAIASIAFNQPAPIVDGNVIRVVTRLHGISENPRDRSVGERIWGIAGELVRAAARKRKSAFRNPAMQLAGSASALNQALMELGATVCLPRQPRCGECPLRNECVARRSDFIDVIPNLGKRPASTARCFHTFVLRHDDRYFVRQRPKGEVNGGFWEFPNVEVIDDGMTPGKSLAGLLDWGRHPASTARIHLKSVGRIQHTITRYRITQHVFAAIVSSAYAAGSMKGKWCTRRELDMLPFVNAQKGIDLGSI